MPLPQIPCQDEEAPLPTKPYLLGKPLPGRRQPVKAVSREAGALNAPTLTGWRWSGLLGYMQARLAFSLTAPTLATVRMTSRLRRLAWRCRRCADRYVVRARAARGRG
jgi:hypothetical protein